MKRVLFLLVSMLLTGTTYASSLSKDIVSLLTNNDEVLLNEQGQSLILEKTMSEPTHVAGHQSHRSHSSHSSHRSHFSSR